jgi:hypothetical protein
MTSGGAAASLSVGFGVGFRFLGLGKPVLFAFRFFGFFFSTTATLLVAAASGFGDSPNSMAFVGTAVAMVSSSAALVDDAIVRCSVGAGILGCGWYCGGVVLTSSACASASASVPAASASVPAASATAGGGMVDCIGTRATSTPGRGGRGGAVKFADNPLVCGRVDTGTVGNTVVLVHVDVADAGRTVAADTVGCGTVAVADNDVRDVGVVVATTAAAVEADIAGNTDRAAGAASSARMTSSPTETETASASESSWSLGLAAGSISSPSVSNGSVV